MRYESWKDVTLAGQRFFDRRLEAPRGGAMAGLARLLMCEGSPEGRSEAVSDISRYEVKECFDDWLNITVISFLTTNIWLE
jgi:hypothetical protein